MNHVRARAILGRVVTRTRRPSIGRVWAYTAGLLTIGTAGSAILAAVTLEMLMQRPSGGGSMTTMMPGAVYAMATVMKVGFVMGLITVSAWIFAETWRRSSGTPTPAQGLPAWGLTAVVLVVSTPWIGAAGAVIAQVFADTGAGLALGDLPQISRVAVFVQLAALLAGAASAAVSLAKDEHPRRVALVGLATTALLVALFWHFQFYAYGFDQDTWAPR